MFDNLPVKKAAQRVIGIVPYSKREQLPIYRATYTQYANASSRPIILIDWSDLDMHKAFLAKLKTIIDDDAKPIIVTDAGYKTTWFR
jgi:hypothetical protein